MGYTQILSRGRMGLAHDDEGGRAAATLRRSFGRVAVGASHAYENETAIWTPYHHASMF